MTEQWRDRVTRTNIFLYRVATIEGRRSNEWHRFMRKSPSGCYSHKPKYISFASQASPNTGVTLRQPPIALPPSSTAAPTCSTIPLRRLRQHISALICLSDGPRILGHLVMLRIDSGGQTSGTRLKKFS